MDKIGKFFSFNGRANRAEFFLALFGPIILFVLVAISGFGIEIVDDNFWFFEIIMFWIWFAGMARRSRDCGKSPLIILIIFIPLVQFGLLIYLLFQEGIEDQNITDEIEQQELRRAVASHIIDSEQKKETALSDTQPTAINENKEIPEGEDLYCTNCGKKARVNDKFCKGCGEEFTE
jgi:uncharacterized membrane protein YhaH (DUF805 family)